MIARRQPGPLENSVQRNSHTYIKRQRQHPCSINSWVPRSVANGKRHLGAWLGRCHKRYVKRMLKRRPGRPILLSLLVLCADAAHGTAVAFWPDGNSACPCINPWAGDAILLNGHAPPANFSGCDVLRGRDRHCYSFEYGALGCQAYDLTATPECALAAKPEPYCAAMWCYVDAATCGRPSAPASYFANTTPALAFSYQTCGYMDTFSDSSNAFAEHLRAAAARQPNGKLLIAFPGDSSSGYTLVGSKTWSDGTPKVAPFQGIGGTNRSGSIVAFLDAIFTEMSVPWEEVPISAREYCLLPTPYSLLPTPYSLLPTPYPLLPSPYSLLLTPYSLHPRAG